MAKRKAKKSVSLSETKRFWNSIVSSFKSEEITRITENMFKSSTKKLNFESLEIPSNIKYCCLVDMIEFDDANDRIILTEFKFTDDFPGVDIYRKGAESVLVALRLAHPHLVDLNDIKFISEKINLTFKLVYKFKDKDDKTREYKERQRMRVISSYLSGFKNYLYKDAIPVPSDRYTFL